jgi:hypothetical protein
MRSILKSLFFAALFVSSIAYGQGTIDPRITYYRNDQQGDIRYRKQGIMDGNLVRTIYYNTGEVAQWPFAPSGEWPKGSGHQYLDGVCVLVAAEVTAPGNGQTVHPLETQYREEMSKDPVTGQIWGFEPVPGYVASSTKVTSPAINRDTTTFPPSWPIAVGVGSEYNGYWYGYFGKGVSNADFETYFVMDDSKDQKFTRPPYSFYPIASDSTRGGLGLRVEVRGFQWSHVLAEDIIFWHYDIVNISDRDLDKTCFGFYSDPGVGGVSSGNDDASYSTVLDLCYAWDHLRKGDPAFGAWIPGMYGYAYLESPGNPWNGIDDDEDGMIDERRDNGIDDQAVHGLTTGVWTKYEDINHNGKWDPGEDIRDDVGLDGVGPNDPSYTGPDKGEADGTATSGYDALGNDTGYPGEPNIDKTDKDESDQIGLSAVSLTPLSDKGPNGVWPKNNEVVWRKMTGSFVDTGITNSNISIVFSSGPFPLKQGRRERYSMALLFGGGGPNSTLESDLAQLVFNKTTVQAIYNANYNFSSPPRTPHLTAVPGDKQVYLYWDNVAEASFDRLLRKKNFEGYTIYKSREAEFNDVHTIVDSKGNPKYWKPIAQYDLIDTISGPDPIGINGAHFWRGDETGLQHSFVDKDVLNGVKYYYAVCSYSKGDPNYGRTGLQPTECTKIITEDVNGVLKFVDINCAVVTPNAATAGYVPASITGDLTKVSQGIGTGSVTLNIMNPNAIIEGAQYKVAFTSSGVIPSYTTKTMDLTRTTGSTTDTMMRSVDLAAITAGKFSPSFDGMTLTATNNAVIDIDTAGWLVGKSNMVMIASADNSASSLNVKWPADYEIKFFNTISDTSLLNPDDPISYPAMPVDFTITNITQGHRVKFFVNDLDNSTSLTAGDIIRITEAFVDISNFRLPWQILYTAPRRDAPVYPIDGDRFIVHTTKPFYTGDAFTFTTKGHRLDNALATNQMDRISVVPNPYVSAAKWEPKTIYGTGRGDRMIDFINLPSNCTIRIYSERGMLVKTLTKGAPGSTDIANGALSWNLVSDDGTDVAFGLYIYHVDAPGVGNHIGKFALIK